MTQDHTNASPALSHRHNAGMTQTALLMIDASEHNVGLPAVLPLYTLIKFGWTDKELNTNTAH